MLLTILILVSAVLATALLATLARTRLAALLLARLLTAALLLAALSRARIILLLARILIGVVGVRHRFLLEIWTRSFAPRGSTATPQQSCAAKR
jgi:hypothetical protein